MQENKEQGGEGRKGWSFCEGANDCNMSYCDENGCIERVRHYVNPDNPVPDQPAKEGKEEIEKLLSYLRDRFNLTQEALSYVVECYQAALSAQEGKIKELTDEI